ncbi:general secretion pathway protein GspN [Dyella sp. LX-66]|uniref:general secretion pathway protein GspN n=1 Tax=unclassified Dyella TaxID=2634549 RepID=UPI001BE04775|nr:MULTISPECIES: general secretion pathway protein GspN [unclassified Dyella]MBT2117505.1 general secretion pathway protein GspN [Dyella sp. LX-1]MBT2119350.1 general secretion pathway protein GspN [Dyella sp. LX-1]MBT2138569.1 general secretion pathway protein GspN [Dyella sp. LX-66]
MNAAAQRRLTPVLGGIAGVLALLLCVLLAGVGRGVHWNPPRPTEPLPDMHDSAADLPRPLPLEQFGIVWQQPVFNPDRKPITRAAKGGASLGEMQLTGIILTSKLHMALLHTRGQDADVRVAEGASLPDGSWKLVEVKPRSAVFESGSGRTELELPAGAPIDAPKADGQPPPLQQQPSNMTGPIAVPPGAVQRVGPGIAPQPPPDGNEPRPQQADSSLQAERIRQLKAAIQKRRAEQQQQQQAGNPEGAH